MTIDESGVKILLSSVFSWVKENGRPVVTRSSSGKTAVEFGIQVEGYPKFINVPYLRRHAIMAPMTSTAVVDKIEQSAFGTNVPALIELMNFYEETEQLWMTGRSGWQPVIFGGVHIAGYINGTDVSFEYTLLPDLAVQFKSDSKW